MPYTFNPSLKNLDLPFEWKGTPLNEKGRFVNLEFPFKVTLQAVLKWQTSRNPQKSEKKNDRWKLEVLSDTGFLTSKKDCIVWLGHASFFIRLARKTILIDPVLFDGPFLRRHARLPVDPKEFINLDYILISHDHRDHCDEKSLRFLSRLNPDAQWLTGLNMNALLQKFTNSNKIQAAGWYQQYQTDLKIAFLPSRHWGRRLFTDTNLRLWGGFVIEGNGKTIYFCGDSGYDSHFTDVGKVFPGIDYCLIGIGAYKPEYFMAQSHTSPADALRAFEETNAKVMIPMHYGTFDLSDEPIGDPLRVLEKLRGTTAKEIKALNVGEVLSLEQN